MRCCGGLFAGRVFDDIESSSSSGTPSTRETPVATLAASCSPAVCAQPLQQNSIQRPQHSPVLGVKLLKLPVKSSKSFPGCIGNSLTGQQEASAQVELDPTGLRASKLCRDSLATSATTPQHSLAAHSAADPMALRTDAKVAKTNQKRSALAMEALTGEPSDTASQARLQDSTQQGNSTTQKETQQSCDIHPDHFQQQKAVTPSARSSLESRTSEQAFATEDFFNWEYSEPKPRHNKDFLGQRKKDIRSSLAWDCNTDTPIVTTRRSKDYGEETQTMRSTMCQGRSYCGSSDSL